jgi:outer membrane receptor protein involved in Fe transport
LILALCVAPALAAQSNRISGIVVDQAGAPVANAEVTLNSGASTQSRITGNDGRFEFDGVTARDATLIVRAQGFATRETPWSGNSAEVEIRLAPQPLSEELTVTAARTATRLSDTPQSVVVLSRDELSTTSALTIDDALRQVPGVGLFRRSGSRTTNPTAQGVSLRGVGASGASRAAVLADLVPLNDPFGGWVYWGRIPRESISRIEVVRGGQSSLYGTDALGGVINFLPRSTEGSGLSFEASYGNQDTADATLFAGARRGDWGGSISAETFHTDGYIIVDRDERGTVDSPAGGDHSVIDLTAERFFSQDSRLFAKGSIFGETRENGTPVQNNRTHIRQLVVGFDGTSNAAGSLSLRGYGGTEVFDQDFSAIAADRNSETITRSQRTPIQNIGFTSQWSRVVGSLQTIVAGLEAREVRGASDELGFFAGNVTSAVGSGGRERTVGVFGQDILRITPRFLLTVGARIDRWRNYDGLSTTRPLALPGPPVAITFEERTETALSPRLSLLYRLSDEVSVVASGYRAFRAPTLNELYRSFRVGNVVTLANSDLRAERLTGGEGGVNVAGFHRRLSLRGVFFWSEVVRPVANVTLSVTPALITRQRQNLGRTRSRGVEIESDIRLTEMMALTAGYEFVDATVLEFPANKSLEGLLIPQVPRHQFTFQFRYANPRAVTLGVQGRAIGAQFDDDQNRLELGRYFTLDALVSRGVGHGVELFAAFENLLDQRYEIGRTPVTTIGPGILGRAGVRFRLGSR